jgi:hypothetical protein
MYAYYFSEHPVNQDSKALFAIVVKDDDLSSFSKEVQLVKERDELRKIADGIDVIIDGVIVNWDFVAVTNSANDATIKKIAELGFSSIEEAVLHLIKSQMDDGQGGKKAKKS